jgi:hypothetical protein
MTEVSRSGERPMTVVCSWCSTEVADGVAQCPTCGANLVPDGDPNVPGVTAVDAASIIRSKTSAQPRSRLLSWISGEYEPDMPSKAEAQAIAPPDDEVRREIFRLELEAEVANLQAEADALRAEAVAEGRTIEELEPEEAASGSGDDIATEAVAATETGETASEAGEPTAEDEDTA